MGLGDASQQEVPISPNLLKLIRTTVWPLTVNLSCPSMAGRMGGVDGRKEEGAQMEEEKEKGNGLWILNRFIKGI